MNERILSLLLFLILMTGCACTKNSDVQKGKIEQGTYYLSGTVIFDAPTLYTKQNSTSDTNVIQAVLDNFADQLGNRFGGVFPDSLQNEFHLNAGTQTGDSPPGNSSLQILPGSTAMLIHCPGMKDTVLCDITANTDGTYTLINKDSSNYAGEGCRELEVSMLDTAGFRKYEISTASQNLIIYRGRDKYLIDIRNKQLSLHRATLFYVRPGCWSFINNTLKRYFPPNAGRLSMSDTILLQNRNVIYKRQ